MSNAEFRSSSIKMKLSVSTHNMSYKCHTNGTQIMYTTFSFHVNSLFGHLVPYKHQRQDPNILWIIHIGTLTHTRTHTHRHMAVYTKPAITVAGINITRCICITNCHYDVHILYIIHSASSRVNSAIFECCSRILSYEYGYWRYIIFRTYVYIGLGMHGNILHK